MSETRTQSRTPRVRVTGVDMMGSSKRSESKQSSELADQISFFISSREYKMPAQLSSSSPTPGFSPFRKPEVHSSTGLDINGTSISTYS
jgi:hypothetical protein